MSFFNPSTVGYAEAIGRARKSYAAAKAAELFDDGDDRNWPRSQAMWLVGQMPEQHAVACALLREIADDRAVIRYLDENRRHIWPSGETIGDDFLPLIAFYL